MLKDFLNAVRENSDMQRNILWGFIALMACIAIYTFASSYWYQKQLNETTLVMNRQIGQFKITNYKGPSPFKVDMTDISTEESLKDVLISVDCPLYQKNAVGLVVPMYKILNLKVSTGEKFFTYEGAYDQLCTNKGNDTSNK